MKVQCTRIINIGVLRAALLAGACCLTLLPAVIGRTADDEAIQPAIAAGMKYNPYGEPLVTNVFADTDIRQALADISMQTGVAIVADSTVQGAVTAEFKDLPLSKALTILLQSGGYAYARIDDYYLIGLPETNNPNSYLLTKTEVVELHYITPQTVMTIFGKTYGRYISAEPVELPTADVRRSGMGVNETSSTGYGYGYGYNARRFTAPTVTINEDGRQGGGYQYGSQIYRVVITASPPMVERIKQDIALLDRPRAQVMFEASVVEISSETLKTVGIDWATRWLRFNSSDNGPNLIYSKIANTEIVSLTALIQNGKATLRANPRVSTSDGQTAEIEVGKENYFELDAGVNTYATLERITSGILFRITPRVIADRNIVVARVEPEVRDVTGKGKNGLPEITFRRASAELRVEDGQSIVIGGLINEYSSKIEKKTPLLGDIPILGLAFRRDETRTNRNEVVIIITPHIIQEGESEPAAGEASTDQAAGSGERNSRDDRLEMMINGEQPDRNRRLEMEIEGGQSRQEKSK